MTFPLTPHYTWNDRDSSKITDYLRCNRLYFYAYVLGWKADVPNQDAHFGHCFHLAREHQLIHGYEDVGGAFQAFLGEYSDQFDQSTDPIYIPKTPAGALAALIKFKDEYSLDLRENELVYIDGNPMTEISGTVPVDENRVLHYRLDSIMRRKIEGKIFSWDHKTTSGKWIHDTRWDEEYHLSIQNGTYTHCLYCMFPIDTVLGIEFYKVGFEYLQRASKNRSAGYHATMRKVPAFKSPDQMNVWLWNVNRILDDIDRDMDCLHHCKEEDQVLMAFPMKPTSCTDFKGCPYHDFCLSWSNPLQKAYEPPLGFRQEFWDPAAMKTRNKRNLEWKGL